MKMIFLFLLVFVSLLGSLAQEHGYLQKKDFIFPTTSNTAYVVLNVRPRRALTSFTVCLRSYTDLTRTQDIFSYATRSHDNEILIERLGANGYELWVGNNYVVFNMQGKEIYTPRWDHICMSWESATGLATLWLNGQPFPQKGLRKGYSISPEAFILLGQDQDSYGGGFVANECFVGELTDVYMFDRVLSPYEVALLLDGSSLPRSDYLINWTTLSYDIKGYVIVKPSVLWGP